MACSCNNRRNNGYGCRRAAVGAVWPTGGYNGYNGYNTAYTSTVDYGCPNSANYTYDGSRGCSCSSCGSSCGSSCSSCGCSSRSCSNAANTPAGFYPGGCGYPPFYCGPCGTVDPICGCTAHCQNGSMPAPMTYGYFTQINTLDIEADEVIPFTGPRNSNGISMSGGTITFDRSGVYLVTLSVDVPSNATLDTTITINQDDTAVSGGTIVIDKAATDDPFNAVRQVIITACKDSTLTVETSDAINLTTASTSDVIASLTITKIA